MRRLAVPIAAGASLALVALVGLTLLRPAAQPTRTELAQQLAGELRCPDCQGLSVADSPSGSAAEIRSQIDRLLAAGLSADQVRSHFVDRYGEWILLAPRAPIAWLLPGAVVLLGLAGLSAWIWRGAARRATGDLRPPPTQADRDRVRGEAEQLDA
jgi:cytochrome c-type biogenesis protein CcmH